MDDAELDQLDQDDELLREAFLLDPTRSNIVLICGTKGTGKSEAARRIFDDWPGDRVAIDPTGNARPDDPDTVAVTAPFPSQIPERLDDRGDRLRTTVWARVNPGSPTLSFDIDQAIGMAMHPRRWTKLIWLDEYGQAATPNVGRRTAGNERTMLLSSRHYNVSALLITPRPRFIPLLAPQQADKLIVFNLPNVEDREVIAKNAGVPVPVFERAYHANRRRGRHAYLLYDRRTELLLDCPPLPDVAPRGPRA